MIIIHTNAHLRAQTQTLCIRVFYVIPRVDPHSSTRRIRIARSVFFSFSLCLPESSRCCCRPTAKDKGEKKLFGYSFVPLMQEDGRTLPDGTHELIIQKVFNIKNNIKIIQ